MRDLLTCILVNSDKILDMPALKIEQDLCQTENGSYSQ